MCKVSKAKKREKNETERKTKTAPKKSDTHTNQPNTAKPINRQPEYWFHLFCFLFLAAFSVEEKANRFTQNSYLLQQRFVQTIALECTRLANSTHTHTSLTFTRNKSSCLIFFFLFCVENEKKKEKHTHNIFVSHLLKSSAAQDAVHVIRLLSWFSAC